MQRYLERAEEIRGRMSELHEAEMRQQKSISSAAAATSGIQVKSSKEECGDIQEKLLRKVEKTVLSERPTICFKDLCGLENDKEALEQAVILPIKRPELFEDGVSPYNGFLFFGVSVARNLSFELVI